VKARRSIAGRSGQIVIRGYHCVNADLQRSAAQNIPKNDEITCIYGARLKIDGNDVLKMIKSPALFPLRNYLRI
jgi:hypothetical protein